MKIDPNKPSPWRNRREAGAYLGISPKTLDEAKRKGRIEPWYMNSKPMYRTTDLDKLMTRKPNPEHP